MKMQIGVYLQRTVIETLDRRLAELDELPEVREALHLALADADKLMRLGRDGKKLRQDRN